MDDYYRGPLQRCNGSEQYKRAESITNAYVFRGGFKPNKCECQRSCYQYIFETYTDTNQRDDSAARVAVHIQIYCELYETNSFTKFLVTRLKRFKSEMYPNVTII